MRGPKPIPTHLKLVRGNPGKRPPNTSEPPAPPALPSAPRYLSPAARKEWRRLGPLLRDAGLLSNLDRNAFACYCGAVARLAEAEGELAAHGMTVTSATGVVKPSPWHYIAAKATAQIATFGDSFGMSPSSRSRVTVDPQAKMQDEFEAFLNRGRGNRPQ